MRKIVVLHKFAIIINIISFWNLEVGSPIAAIKMIGSFLAKYLDKQYFSLNISAAI